MISLIEIEDIAEEILGEHVHSLRQVNHVTIRLHISDGFIDVFQSVKDPKKYAIHLELKNGKIFRLDCRPERKYSKLKSFPWHFHKKTESNIVLSPFSIDKKIALTQFLKFAKKELQKNCLIHD